MADETVRPNILFVICDDLGINDLRCYGRKDHNTPNLDHLAEQGVRFTSAYASQPICSQRSMNSWVPKWLFSRTPPQ